jgi:hypothetical protein
MPKRPRAQVINAHHIVYPSPEHPEQECIVRVRKCEHLVLTRLQWYCKKQVSRGLLTALKVFIALNESRAKEV